jgi:hypothetical protein
MTEPIKSPVQSYWNLRPFKVCYKKSKTTAIMHQLLIVKLEMFKDQIPDKPRFSNVSVPVAKPELANPTPLTPMPDDHTEGWGLSFSISHFAEATGRAPAAGNWEGLPNLFWFADRKNNIGGIIASQILPYGGK